MSYIKRKSLIVSNAADDLSRMCNWRTTSYTSLMLLRKLAKDYKSAADDLSQKKTTMVQQIAGSLDSMSTNDLINDKHPVNVCRKEFDEAINRLKDVKKNWKEPMIQFLNAHTSYITFQKKKCPHIESDLSFEGTWSCYNKATLDFYKMYKCADGTCSASDVVEGFVRSKSQLEEYLTIAQEECASACFAEIDARYRYKQSNPYLCSDYESRKAEYIKATERCAAAENTIALLKSLIK